MTEIIRIIASLFMITFTCFSFSWLIRLRRDFGKQKALMMHMNATLFGIKIRQDIDTMQEMKAHMQHCVDEEDFENAEKLKKLIVKQAKSIENQLEMFRKVYGDICDINVEVIK